MRKQDIKADGHTVYAYAPAWEWNGRYTTGRRAKPVVVLATGVQRTAGFTTSPADGVRLMFLDDDGKPSGETFVARSAEIREPWTDYKAVADEVAQRHEEIARRRRREREETLTRVDGIFALLGHPAQRPYWLTPTTFAFSGNLTALELSELLEVAYAAGVNAGRRQS